MPDSLPEEKLNLLLPCLGQLAKVISIGENLDRHILAQIASRVDLSKEEWAIEELQFWGSILGKIPESSNAKELIVAELQSRGIPEFPAMLAFESAKPKPLNVEPKYIDFGILEIGEGASTTLQANGEPILEVIESARVKVSLLKQPSNKTLVKLQLTKGNSGESITEKIKLRGKSSEVVVTITARWEEEKPLLSFCPVCKISKKSLFWNKYENIYECLNLECKARGADINKLISPYKWR